MKKFKQKNTKSKDQANSLKHDEQTNTFSLTDEMKNNN